MQNTYDSVNVGDIWVLRKGPESGLKNDYEVEITEKGAINLFPEDESATRIIGVSAKVRKIDDHPIANDAVFGEPLIMIFTQMNFEGGSKI